MQVTISYITNRLEPKIEWFFGSLAKQGGTDIPVNVIDYHAGNPDRVARVKALADHYGIQLQKHIEPMPNVWQGKYRLTKADYFAASNASNTAIAACPTEWVAFVDDLSVFQPGWLNCVKEATTRNGITCGAYRKVFKLEVEDGIVTHYENSPGGNDRRMDYNGPNTLTVCSGQWFYGCSFVAPIEALLTINGFDQDCDGMGYQDTAAGVMLANQGFTFWYDSRMMTWESEELHGQPGNKFIRWDPGNSPDDKSHALVDMLNNGRKYAPNYYGEGGLREVRRRYLAGEPFPIIQVPDREWFTGKLLKNLPDAA